MKYDYLVVGAGLFGATFAQQMTEAGRRVLVIDRRAHVAGNAYTQRVGDVEVHMYGPHLFHTNDERVWQYVSRFCSFNNYQHRVKSVSGGKLYTLPFCLMTFYELWGCRTPQEAEEIIRKERVEVENPRNLEEFAISQIGPTLYHRLVYGYTKKQWGRDPKELPPSIIRRLPYRLTFNDNYFDDRYQGVPEQGYTQMVSNMLAGTEVQLGQDFSAIPNWRAMAEKLVYTGSIDRLFDCRFGPLDYRSLEFKNILVDGDFQGMGQINYADEGVPYTRVVEHQHFAKKADRSVVTYEYPVDYAEGRVPYYPINDTKNSALYQRYKALACELPDVLVGGRLGRYQYYNMDQVIASALVQARKELAQTS